jgi:DNA polymerase/3'-5' exonuclease PolX
VKLRYWVAGALALGLVTVGPGHTFRLALLATTLVIPVGVAWSAITSGPRVPDYRERYLLRMQGIDPEQLPEDWRELSFRQWEIVQNEFERSARLLFPGQDERQANWVGRCWMSWDVRQMDIDRAKAAENNIRQLEVR